ncbi:MAG: hypothetical protein MUF54_18935, partial [Polyangiaceae bacterium]|nr:hypothetical protein [Polyangiaceae bacterium]
AVQEPLLKARYPIDWRPALLLQSSPVSACVAVRTASGSDICESSPEHPITSATAPSIVARRRFALGADV